MTTKATAKTPAAGRNSSFAITLLPLIPLILGIAAYWSAFHAPMVFDDYLSIQKQASVRFGDILHSSFFAPRSLLYVTYTLNYRLNGQDVFGYHLVNFALHALTGLLVFFIAEHIFTRVLADQSRARLYAALASACFVLHPIQTESVTYISSRSEVFSTFFYAAAFLTFIKWRREIGFRLSFIIIGLYLLALGGKETTITLPLVLLLYDWLFLADGSVQPIISRWKFYLPFILGGIIAGAYLAIPLFRYSIGRALPQNLPYLHYGLTQTKVIVRYMQLLLLPVNQNLDYDIRPSKTLLDPAVISSVLVIVAALFFAWRMRRKNPVVAFAIFWFFITLAPTSSFVPIPDVMFEHRLYLPMLGVCLLFPLIGSAAAALIQRSFTKRVTPATAATIMLALLFVATVRRNLIWASDVALWQDAVAKSPRKARPYNALSYVYFKRGEYQKAIQVSERALQLNPQLSTQFNETIGNMYLKLGNYNKAEEALRKNAEALKSAQTYNNLGVVYLYMWDQLKQRRQLMTESDFVAQRDRILTKARDAFVQAVALDENAFWTFDSYINVEYDLGHGDQLEAASLDKSKSGDRLDVLYAIAKLRFLRNDFAGAIPFFQRAAKIVRPTEDYKLFFFNFAYALDQTGELDRAVEQYTKALIIDPVFLEASHNLGIVLFKKKDYPAARKNFADALLADPNHVTAYKSHLYLSRIALQLGETQTAKTEVETALKLRPNDPEALQLLQRIGS